MGGDFPTMVVLSIIILNLPAIVAGILLKKPQLWASGAKKVEGGKI